jgi:hypothetical protein
MITTTAVAGMTAMGEDATIGIERRQRSAVRRPAFRARV